MEVYSTVLWHMRKEVELSHLAQDAMELDRLAPQTWYVLQIEHVQQQLLRVVHAAGFPLLFLNPPLAFKKNKKTGASWATASACSGNTKQH